MKCPRCSNRMYGNGWRKSKSVHTHTYKCHKCGTIRSGEKRMVEGYMPVTPEEHARRVSLGLLRYYREAPAEQIATHKKAVKDALNARRVKKPPARKENFIGMLGDIEVYATNFGRVGRSPKNVSSKWAGPAHGKPELKMKKRAVG